MAKAKKSEEGQRMKELPRKALIAELMDSKDSDREWLAGEAVPSKKTIVSARKKEPQRILTKVAKESAMIGFLGQTMVKGFERVARDVQATHDARITTAEAEVKASKARISELEKMLEASRANVHESEDENQ